MEFIYDLLASGYDAAELYGAYGIQIAGDDACKDSDDSDEESDDSDN